MASPVHLSITRYAEIKKEHGIKSDREMAARLNMSAPLLAQIKTGQRGVSAMFITAMLCEFGIPFTVTGTHALYRLNGRAPQRWQGA